jgi:2-amino-4-hydroxy-6-hydroxymethyldihydropteridine diphosphokinase
MAATMSAKNSAISIPRIEATRLTTAFDERSELRNSRHLSQIKVSSWDIRLMIQNAYVGLGSNLGDRAGYLLLAVRGMLDAGLDIIRLSSIYETEAVEYEEQPAFLNLVAELRGATLPTPEQTLARLLRIEYALGRTRDVRMGPRTIDLDLLIFKDARSDTAFLKLPHPRIAARRFVLVPLAELVPNLVHPVVGKSIRELLAQTEDSSSVVRWLSPPRHFPL